MHSLGPRQRSRPRAHCSAWASRQTFRAPSRAWGNGSPKTSAPLPGIFNAGTNTGAILTPLIVPLIALNWGWRWAFVVTGSLGFLWLFLWLSLYRSSPLESRAPSPQAHLPWLRLLT